MYITIQANLRRTYLTKFFWRFCRYFACIVLFLCLRLSLLCLLSNIRFSLLKLGNKNNSKVAIGKDKGKEKITNKRSSFMCSW